MVTDPMTTEQEKIKDNAARPEGGKTAGFLSRQPVLTSMETTGGRESFLATAWRPWILLVLSLLVILITIWSLGHGIQLVFNLFYYVPIILAAYWYREKGILYAAGMGLVYFECVLYYTGFNPLYLIAAAARVATFVIIAGVIVVLSRRIAAQYEKIAESERMFHGVWNRIQAGIIIVDAASHAIIAANPEAERMTGYTEHEMIGQSCHKFICPAEKGQCPICDLHLTIDRSERVVLHRSGETVPVLKTVTPTTISGREVLIESFIEIAALKRS